MILTRGTRLILLYIVPLTMLSYGASDRHYRIRLEERLPVKYSGFTKSVEPHRTALLRLSKCTRKQSQHPGAISADPFANSTAYLKDLVQCRRSLFWADVRALLSTGPCCV